MQIEKRIASSAYLIRLSSLSEFEPSIDSDSIKLSLLGIFETLREYDFDDLEQAQLLLLQTKVDFNYVWSLAAV